MLTREQRHLMRRFSPGGLAGAAPAPAPASAPGLAGGTTATQPGWGTGASGEGGAVEKQFCYRVGKAWKLLRAKRGAEGPSPSSPEAQPEAQPEPAFGCSKKGCEGVAPRRTSKVQQHHHKQAIKILDLLLLDKKEKAEKEKARMPSSAGGAAAARTSKKITKEEAGKEKALMPGHVRGVHFHLGDGKWHSRITKKKIHLGSYHAIEDAARAYDRAAIANLGRDRALTNFDIKEYADEFEELEKLGVIK